MKIVRLDKISGSKREVHCPIGGFISYRFLLESDGMGFSFHRTFIPKGEPQHWHYKNHLEACYCIKGEGMLKDLKTGKVYIISPNTLYALDKNDDHMFQAIEDTILLCVFNPAVTGREVHGKDGSYKIKKARKK